MANEFIARKGIISLDSIQVTGSISATGGIIISGSIASASYASNAELLDGRDSTIFATTGSNIFSGNQTICANLTTTCTITAQTLVVQTVTSSIVYSSGSNIFGNQLTDTQRFTGSVLITGSLTVRTTAPELTVGATGVTLGNVVGDVHQVTGSMFITGSILRVTATNTCFSGQVCSNTLSTTGNATIGGTITGTTIYGSTAICGAVICGGATTLTGALSGTSATFSGNLEVFNSGAGQTAGDFIVNPTTKYVYVGRQSTTSGDNTTFVVRDRTGAARATIPGGGSVDTVFSTNSSNFKVTNYSGTDLLSISNTGAATFSSSVTATQLNATTTTAGYAAILTNTNGASDSNGLLVKAGSTSTEYNVRFANQTDTTTFFTVKGNGNVGIGVGNPGSKLDIAWGGYQTSGYAMTFGADIGNLSTRTNNTIKYGIISGVPYANANPNIELITYYSNSTENSISIGGSGNTDLDGVNIIGFATAPNQTSPGVERMRITSGGYTKMSNDGSYLSSTAGYHEMRQTTTSQYITNFSNSSATPYGIDMYFATPANNTTSQFFIGRDGNANRIIIYSNGNIVNTNGSYGTISDIALKENIIDATSKLEDILKLKVRNFNFKNEPTQKQIGFIAQEFEEVFPSMIDLSFDKATNNEYKTIKTSVLIPVLVKAIQEQQCKIKTLESCLGIN
jgi:hypothetical protein